MSQIRRQIRAMEVFEIATFSMQSAKHVTTAEGALKLFVDNLSARFKRPFPQITDWTELHCSALTILANR